jgi:hypothetical protein
LAPALAWLLASVEEERVCFEVAALAADAPAAGLVADVAAEELVVAAVVAVLAADGLAAEPVAVADAGELVLACSALAALAADGLVAELVVGAAAAVLVADGVAALAAGALVAGLVVDVVAEPESACFELEAVPAADELAAELVAGAQAALQIDWQAVGCDWAAAGGAPVGLRVVGCDSVEHSAEPQPADEHR